MVVAEVQERNLLVPAHFCLCLIYKYPTGQSKSLDEPKVKSRRYILTIMTDKEVIRPMQVTPFIAELFIEDKKWKQPKYTLTGEWILGMHIHTMKYSS